MNASTLLFQTQLRAKIDAGEGKVADEFWVSVQGFQFGRVLGPGARGRSRVLGKHPHINVVVPVERAGWHISRRANQRSINQPVLHTVAFHQSVHPMHHFIHGLDFVSTHDMVVVVLRNCRFEERPTKCICEIAIQCNRNIYPSETNKLS